MGVTRTHAAACWSACARFEGPGVDLQRTRDAPTARLDSNAGKINGNCSRRARARAAGLPPRENESIDDDNKVDHLFDGPRYRLACSKTVMPSHRRGGASDDPLGSDNRE